MPDACWPSTAATGPSRTVATTSSTGTYDEDRCTIRTGHGPANITRLRRFAIGLLKSKVPDSVAAAIRKLQRNVRPVFDYLRMTENSRPRNPAQCVECPEAS